MENNFIYELIEACKEYEASKQNKLKKNNLKDFSTWLFNKTQHSENNDANYIVANKHEIGRIVTYLYRYAKNYAKLALQNKPLVSLDDFVFLSTLHELKSLTKMTLIESHVIEKQTGIQVIKRLVEQGLIIEQKDKQDKRSTRISLTKKGEKVILSCYLDMGIVADLVTGDLTNDELNTLYQLLQKLDNFHSPIYKKINQLSFEELKEIKPNPFKNE